MYDFIFYFVYVQHIARDGNKTARAFGALLVLFSIFGQAFVCSNYLNIPILK